VRKILVLSDIHANLDALDAVLRDAGQTEEVWCLGDLVGYGPDPKECVERVANLSNLVCLLGNHDAAVTGKLDLSAFNRDAILSVQWSRAQLNNRQIELLAGLPEVVVKEGVTLTHGSPRNPIWEYLLDINTVQINFSHFSTPFCFVGHTHIPIWYTLNNNGNGNQHVDWMTPPVGEPGILHPKAILNPGSVGQPRDRDSRASYAIYYPENKYWELRRVKYNIQAVQNRINSAGLPARHSARLEDGW
jgi:diadenosine tetraphosphatase ApaH/serine/threonine PP2A family protein phosphatase